MFPIMVEGGAATVKSYRAPSHCSQIPRPALQTRATPDAARQRSPGGDDRSSPAERKLLLPRPDRFVVEDQIPQAGHSRRMTDGAALFQRGAPDRPVPAFCPRFHRAAPLASGVIMDWLGFISSDGKLFGIQWNVWKVVGWLGNAVFFSRFMVQWYATERKRQVVVPPAFWWLSLVGSLLLLAYAVFTGGIRSSSSPTRSPGFPTSAISSSTGGTSRRTSRAQNARRTARRRRGFVRRAAPASARRPPKRNRRAAAVSR